MIVMVNLFHEFVVSLYQVSDVVVTENKFLIFQVVVLSLCFVSGISSENTYES